MDTVPAGLGSHVHDRVPDARRARVEDPVGTRDPNAHDVDENVAVEAVVEGAFAADRWHTDAIAVAADPSDDPLEEVSGLRVIGLTETERIEDRDRAGPHGENVAEDAANTGRGTLERLDEGGVIVAFHLKDGDQALADVDNARVLARALDHPRRFGRELAQVGARGFVGAVLAPHHRKDPKLHEVGVPAQDRRDALVLVGGETVLRDDLGRKRLGGNAHGLLVQSAEGETEARRGAPSVPPRRGSQARSGWGMMPSTLRPVERMPAIRSVAPLTGSR